MNESIENELAQIDRRIAARRDLELRDRARQAELCRTLIARGWTWDQVQDAARITRTRLRDALRS